MFLKRSFVLLCFLISLAPGFFNLPFIPLLHLSGNSLKEVLRNLQCLWGVSERGAQWLAYRQSGVLLLLVLGRPCVVQSFVPRLPTFAGFLCLSSFVEEVAALWFRLCRFTQGLQSSLNPNMSWFGPQKFRGGQLLLEPMECAGTNGFVLWPDILSRDWRLYWSSNN